MDAVGSFTLSNDDIESLPPILLEDFINFPFQHMLVPQVSARNKSRPTVYEKYKKRKEKSLQKALHKKTSKTPVNARTGGFIIS